MKGSQLTNLTEKTPLASPTFSTIISIVPVCPLKNLSAFTLVIFGCPEGITIPIQDAFNLNKISGSVTLLVKSIIIPC